MCQAIWAVISAMPVSTTISYLKSSELQFSCFTNRNTDEMILASSKIKVVWMLLIFPYGLSIFFSITDGHTHFIASLYQVFFAQVVTFFIILDILIFYSSFKVLFKSQFSQCLFPMWYVCWQGTRWGSGYLLSHLPEMQRWMSFTEFKN